MEESQVKFESDALIAFRNNVLNGEWADVLCTSSNLKFIGNWQASIPRSQSGPN